MSSLIYGLSFQLALRGMTASSSPSINSNFYNFVKVSFSISFEDPCHRKSQRHNFIQALKVFYYSINDLNEMQFN